MLQNLSHYDTLQNRIALIKHEDADGMFGKKRKILPDTLLVVKNNKKCLIRGQIFIVQKKGDEGILKGLKILLMFLSFSV